MRLLMLAPLVLASSQAFAQAPPAGPNEVAVAPIECWWKTDRSAVRVGELFQLTLTCAVLDTDKVKVAVDESSLAPSALHLVPFEIVRGQRFRDILNRPRRFFQYQYSMRVLGEDFFDKDLPLPRLQISYRVQNALGSGQALAGREAQYSLRPVPIHVLSLVPGAGADIRDTPPDTFADIDSRLFRSNALLITAGVALAFSALLLLVAVVRTTLKRRSTTRLKKRTLSPALVLRAASRELGAVGSAAERDGWNGDLAGRAAAALRLAGAVALRRPVNQLELASHTPAAEGQIAVRPLWRRKAIALSSALTSDASRADGTAHDAVRSGDARLWDGLSQALSTFTAVRYSRNGTPDGAALDAALAEAQDLVKRLRRRRLIPVRRARTPAAAATKQTWAR